MWKRSSSRAERFPKILFALFRCRIAEDEVPQTCSPDCRYMPTGRGVLCVFCCVFPSAPARIYRKEPLGFLAYQKPSRLRVPKIPRVKSITDSKWQNKSVKRSRVLTSIGPYFTGASRARALRPKPVPGKARRASMRVFFLLSLTHICKRMLCTNGTLRFYWNYLDSFALMGPNIPTLLPYKQYYSRVTNVHGLDLFPSRIQSLHKGN
jgi:hypothetical protein